MLRCVLCPAPSVWEDLPQLVHTPRFSQGSLSHPVTSLVLCSAHNLAHPVPACSLCADVLKPPPLQEVPSPLEFEQHAKSEAQRAADHIFVDYPPLLATSSGNLSLKDLADAGCKADSLKSAAEALLALLPWKFCSKDDLMHNPGGAGVGAGAGSRGLPGGGHTDGTPQAAGAPLSWRERHSLALQGAPGSGGAAGAKAKGRAGARALLQGESLREIPTNSKMFLGSGLMEQVPVKYMDASGKVRVYICAVDCKPSAEVSRSPAAAFKGCAQYLVGLVWLGTSRPMFW